MNTENTILVVDDTLENLQVVGSVLKAQAYNIALATDGKSALEIVKENVIDLILLDIMMPGMDGYEVCQVLKADKATCHIPVIFLTARTEVEDLVTGFDAGGVDYIIKPFNHTELLARIKTHLELHNARNKIVEFNKTRDKLYSIIAHDLRSPLAGIKMTVGAINDGLLAFDSPDFKELMMNLQETTDNTFQLLTDLLTWTRNQDEKVNLDLKPINLDYIVNDCLTLLQGNARLKDITVENHCLSDALCIADEVTIHTTIRNLLSNAIKFTPNKGSIKISTSSGSQMVTVSIKDTGIGMSQEVVEKLLNVETHYTTPGTNKEMGTGLGLVMVRNFMESNRGKIEIISQPKEGTEVILHLPIAD